MMLERVEEEAEFNESPNRRNFRSKSMEENGRAWRWSEVQWTMVILLFLLHIFSIRGLWLLFTKAKRESILFIIFIYLFSGFGVTAGAHRLWSHRSYKAILPLRIFLAFFQTMACQRDIYEWSRDHRVHHKFTETPADPHNIHRGFFFAHIGWLLLSKRPEVEQKATTIDYNDLLEDPVVVFQRRWYIPLVIFSSIILPTTIPVLFWGEDIQTSFLTCVLFRLVILLHIAFSINSFAHLWGNRPYNPSIWSTDNEKLSLLALGEGYHNFHHTFPWDYSTGEFGWKFNMTTMILDILARIGWVYDRKTVSKEIIKSTIIKNKNKTI